MLEKQRRGDRGQKLERILARLEIILNEPAVGYGLMAGSPRGAQPLALSKPRTARSSASARNGLASTCASGAMLLTASVSL